MATSSRSSPDPTAAAAEPGAAEAAASSCDVLVVGAGPSGIIRYHLRRRVSKLDAVVHSKATAGQLKPVDHDRLSYLAGA